MSPSEINEAVARKLHPAGSCHCPEQGLDCSCSEIPDYCHSIEAAWEIVEKIKGANPYNRICLEWLNGEWFSQMIVVPDEKADRVAQADTAPMAICQAFLKLENA